MSTETHHQTISPYGSTFYRALAEHCRQEAERVEHDEFGVRQKYLDLAEKWDWLAQQAQTP